MDGLRWAAVAAVLLCNPVAFADASSGEPRARVTFGDDAVVAAGEAVREVVTMGGDARVEGTVLGDVVTMGGDAEVVGGTIDGDVVTMGGDVRMDGGDIDGDVVTMGGKLDRGAGRIGGEIVTAGPSLGVGRATAAAGAWPGHGHDGGGSLLGGLGGWIADAVSSLVSYGLLFLLGLLLMGLGAERFGALQVAIVRQPLRAGALGVLSFLGAVVAIVVLCVTIIGIPAGLLVAMALPIALYVGLAACASVLGAALPVEAVRGKPVVQLAAGTAILFVASLVPWLGDILVALAALVGLGALAITRFGKQGPPERTEATPAGPFRTSAV